MAKKEDLRIRKTKANLYRVEVLSTIILMISMNYYHHILMI